MAISELPRTPELTISPERERVSLRPGPFLDAAALGRLEDEAGALIGRGFEYVTLDLRAVEHAGVGTAATLAAIDRHAHLAGARVTVLVGSSPAVRELVEVGLLGGLAADSRHLFFEWSR
jgi:anti-anti-sigma regulatory factor